MCAKKVAINKEYKEFVDKLNIGNGKYNRIIVIQDLIQMFAITIKNTYDYNQEDEDYYLRIINKYTKQEQEEFVKLSAELTLLYVKQGQKIKDILGEIYERIGATNKNIGQFFTPFHVSRSMGKMIKIEELLKDKEYITIHDPCCGSGSIPLGYVEENRYKIDNFSEKVVISANDIDFNCVCMTFIQFVMYGIPAQVTFGNAFEKKKIKTFHTPEFYINDWFNKLKMKENRNARR